IVIGYVDVTQEQIKRIFISNKQLDNWGFYLPCQTTVIDNNQDSILKYGNALLPTDPKTVTIFGVVDFYAADPTCVDCRLRGTNVRPSFWP
ncbi:MAG: hypothetical protein ABI861_12575, partial [Panacibacter sp.]